MVTKKSGSIEIDLGTELMKKLEAVTEKNGITPESLLHNFVLDYIVSGGHPEQVGDRRPADRGGC